MEKMEKKSKIIIAGIALLLIILLVLLISKIFNKKDNVEIPLETTDIEIVYKQSGGGPNLQYKIDPVTVKISYNNIEISYEDKIIKVYTLESKKYTELIELINKNFYKDNKDLSNNSTMDGGSAYITITNKETEKSYTVGGYAVNDEKFSKIEDKIIEIIGEDTIDDFRKNELQEYLENRSNDFLVDDDFYIDE